MDWDKIYWNEFYDLVEKFENEEINHDEFISELNEYEEYAVDSIGEDTYNYWLNINSDYVALKKFNRNENQIALF
ncbi:hypothetical protein ACODHD_01800 [Vagococcus fluvialis]|jgi:hypothetical protein|uniref:hypothetical protein n=1 Tax=Vagococcus fluvialis TaxID=2738 RepID=UPI001D0BD996|nr:hypothetical protein [Vagococcus fluvialis]MDR2277952.1 hypothetical protein [Vagococcus sp.]UDM72378.1 hypothetical protein K5L00_06590 [Vagococcus fluvialis]UDM77243.1 hypothetical protein K5K98_02130 [Vagococcus fluvialis]UDM81513.1 hypothetical protein K5K96_09065 [Vagococcus fluvialis]